MKKAYNEDERVGCTAHIIHSSVSKGINDVPVVKSLLEKTRKISQRHNKSYAMRNALEEAQKKHQIKCRPLQQDVPTRWGSSRTSLGSFLDENIKKSQDDSDESASDDDDITDFKNCEAINDALRKQTFKNREQLNQFLLTRSEMSQIKNVHKLLTKLDVFSTTLGGDKYVTISLVLPVIKTMKNDIEYNDYRL